MTKRPLILILITKADIGGAQVHVLEILNRLKSRYHFILATGESGYLTEHAQEQGIEVTAQRVPGDPMWATTETVTNSLLEEVTVAHLAQPIP